MIWIRADANERIGTGHVMRCLSIAGALKKAGEQVCFLVADEKAAELLKGRGQQYLVLHTDYREMEQELDILRGILGRRTDGKFESGAANHFGWEAMERRSNVEGPAAMLVDSYFATAGYLRKVRSLVPVACMDDLGRRDLPVDLVINYNIYADGELYGVPDEKAPRYCLGTEYAPLREEFLGVDYLVREKAARVLVTTGGADKFNIAGKFVEKALGHPATAKLEYWVVSGAMNEHLPHLRRLEEGHSNVKVFCNVSNMSELMQACDLAFTAGGSTVYELSAVGVPLLCFSFVENQRMQVETFYRRGYSCFGGDYAAEGVRMLDAAVKELGELAADFERRKSYSEKQRCVVDGKGAARIAEALMAQSIKRRG